MDITSKLKALDQIYAVYESFIDSLDLACKKYCDHCCTSGVILTTLEGYKIIDRLGLGPGTEVTQKIHAAAKITRFRPRITTNRLARLCAAGLETAEVIDNENWQACPVLQDHHCPVYEWRPFGCRCLISRRHCGERGYAEMDDFVLSVNTLILQTIEHVDAEGCSGNLVDVLRVMSLEENRATYINGRLHCTSNGLIANQPLEVLMIPPEHRAKIEPILRELRQIKA